MKKRRGTDEVAQGASLQSCVLTMHDGSTVSVPMMRTKEGPAPDWRTQPACDRCGGHADEHGEPAGGTLPVWRYVTMPHKGPDGKITYHPQGNWKGYAAACSCVWGARIRHLMPSLERMSGRIMGWYEYSPMRLEGCSGSDLAWLGIHLHGDAKLEDAVRKITYPAVQDRLLRAIDTLHIREEHGSR